MKSPFEHTIRRLAVAAATAALLWGCQGPEKKDAGGATPPEKELPFVETPANLARSRHMAMSMTLFSLYHEFGHFIVNEYDPAPPPRSNSEGFDQARSREIAADRFAAWAMTPQRRPAGAPPESFDPAEEPDTPGVLWAVMWWQWIHYRSGQVSLPDDVHLPNLQRGQDLMCLVYGGEPERFERVAKGVLPAERLAGCAAEAAANNERWNKLLAPEVMKPNELGRYRTSVEYRAAPAELVRGRDMTQESQTLEQVAAIISKLRTRPGLVDPWKPGLEATLMLQQMKRRGLQATIYVVAEPCRDDQGHFTVNAFWNPEDREVTLCYALVNVLDDWARRIIAQTSVGRGKTANPLQGPDGPSGQ